ncbi:hypothetical protein [Kibdelosporangium philippinense]|uniref:hypothetical protein n=1 Tax=Kibdelosporangium philippinense TaxID=211113 RepID=UPI00361A3F73
MNDSSGSRRSHAPTPPPRLTGTGLPHTEWARLPATHAVAAGTSRRSTMDGSLV